MRISDFIIFDAPDSSPEDDRRFGTVLRFDIWSWPAGGKSERLAEILWNTGRPGWINVDRIRVDDETR